ncbi:MAG: pentapeptide repeat-containing protein [Nitrospinota bacterium]|nr:pentapeptide repeat-containing protein [Nitrospinota bacterium]
MSETDNKKPSGRISRSGLMKWIVINNLLDPDFRKELLSGDYFLLGAWEAWIRGKKGELGEKFIWEGEDLYWKELPEHKTSIAIKKAYEEKEMKPETKFKSSTRFLQRWSSFSEKWADKECFEGRFLEKGDNPVFDSKDKCKGFIFISQFVVNTENEPKNERAKVRIVNGYRIERLSNLQGADLAGANLQGSILFGADLAGANLQGIDLKAAKLMIANLQGADLAGADLAGADLMDAKLEGANLMGTYVALANLEGANLFDADLYGTNLTGANLMGANLTGVINLTVRHLSESNWNDKTILPDYIIEKLRD